MSEERVEGVASLHVLAWMAKADGTLHKEERDALENALDAVGLNDFVSARELFEDDFSIEDQLALLRRQPARDEAFRAAYSLALADGTCTDEERERLAFLRRSLEIGADREAELARVFAELTAPAESASPLVFIDDAEERTAVVRDLTRRCAIQSAILGAFPVPILSLVTDLAIVALQLDLVRDIGAVYGKTLDRRISKSLLASAGMTGARLAVSNLAKLMPFWGSVIASTAAFASTYAVGIVFERHFAKDGGLEEAELRAAIREAQAEGKKAYEASRAEIEAKRTSSKEAIDRLAAASAEISPEELARRASRL